MDEYPPEVDLEKYYRRRRLKESGIFLGGLAVLGGTWYLGDRFVDWGWQGNMIIGFATAMYTFNYMIVGLPHC